MRAGCGGEAGIDGSAVSFILLVDDLDGGVARGPFVGDLGGAVLRAIVDDNRLEFVAVSDERGQRPIEVVLGVVGGHDHRQQRRAHGVSSREVSQ